LHFLKELHRSSLLAILLLALSFLLPVHSAALEIRAGLEQNPPLSFIDEQGQPAGLLVELLNSIAADSDWQIVYVPDTFEKCLQKLNDHEIDLMVTIAYSKERAEKFDFNQVNVVANWGVLYSSIERDIESYLDLKGMTVAVMKKDIHHSAFRDMLASFDVPVDYLKLDNFEQVFSAIDSGQADAGVVSRFYALSKAERLNVKATPLLFSPIEVRYATAKGKHGKLLQTLDHHLRQMKKDPSSAYYHALNQWLDVPGKSAVPKWLWPTFLVLVTLLLIAIAFVSLLRRQVRIRSQRLNDEIGRRANTQQELLVAEANYRTLVENANAIILRWDQNGDITYINDFGLKLFGYEKDELVGKNVVGTIVPDISTDGRDLVKMIHSICESPDDYHINENENTMRSGERVWISWRNQPVHNQVGEIDGILSVGQDITEKKKAELSRLQYDHAKDTFMSAVAHELRTPLTAMLGYTELLAIAPGIASLSPEKQQEFLDTICTNALMLSRIVDDLLDVGRIQQGKPLPLKRQKDSFASLIKSLLQQYQTLNPSYLFHLNVHADLCDEQFFDRERMSQVLENLLSNAVKYSDQGSEILVDLSVVDDSLQVTVADQGVGMTPEQIEKVFDDFYRVDTSNTAISGLGLGMCIARQIVLEHGGKIWVESMPDVGTKIYFTLPAISAANSKPSLSPSGSS